MPRVFMFLGALLAFLAVSLGAFGAHALRKNLTPEMIEIYRTGVLYHMFHALGILCIGILARTRPESRLFTWSGWLLLTGIVLFSGSLYALSITGLRALGVITPIGGTAFLFGWLLLAVGIIRSK